MPPTTVMINAPPTSRSVTSSEFQKAGSVTKYS